MTKDEISRPVAPSAAQDPAAAFFQGTGTTIVDVAPDGTVSLFAQINATKLPGECPGDVGLTTALVVFGQAG